MIVDYSINSSQLTSIEQVTTMVSMGASTVFAVDVGAVSILIKALGNACIDESFTRLMTLRPETLATRSLGGGC